jgi:serine/threonine-protein kinase
MPSRIGRYDLLARLGAGGMASVYLARSFGSAGFERLAAVKVLHREMCADDDFVEMFLDEARVAARLHHPNATAIIDLGAEGPLLYMVMEYVQGDTLHAIQHGASSRQETIPIGVALRVVLDALAGLDAAHELRGTDGEALELIHRDVTPHNVIVGIDGAARLADFGIARAASRKNSTGVGVVKGKLAFMAPEHLRGRRLDRRADIFSMGVTLWETMSLRRCFPQREGAPFARPENERYVPLGEVAPNVPPAMDAICRQALAFDPIDRFPTAAAFAEAIEAEFRYDVATQRELGQYVSVVAAEKVRREREAVRLSSQPMPNRPAPAPAPARPGRRSAPVIEIRAQRTHDIREVPSRLPSGRIDDRIEYGDDTTNVVAQPRPAPPPQRTAPPPARRPSVEPRPPASAGPARASESKGINEAPTRRIRIAPPSRSVDAASLYELATQAFTLQRPRRAASPQSATRDTLRPPGRASQAALAAVDDAGLPSPAPPSTADTVGPPVVAPDDADLTFSVRRPPRSFRSPPSRRPRASRAPSRLRLLARRLWRFFVR